jgi:hypothetical protein
MSTWLARGRPKLRCLSAGRGESGASILTVAGASIPGAIADMIESGGAADAVPLARRAVERVTAAILQAIHVLQIRETNAG